MFHYDILLLGEKWRFKIFLTKIKIKYLYKIPSLGADVEGGNMDRVMTQAVSRRPLSGTECCHLWWTKWQ